MDIQSQTLLSAYSPTPAAAARARNSDPEQAAKEFEAVFLTNFLSSMFTGVSTEAPFGGGQAEETWRGFLIKEYADQIVASGGIGIADHVHRELISLQEQATK